MALSAWLQRGGTRLRWRGGPGRGPGRKKPHPVKPFTPAAADL